MSAGAMVGVGFFSLIFGLAMWILQVVAYWKIFEKAGEKGWKSLIPFYNFYVQCKLTWKTKFFWVIMALAVVVGLADGIATDIQASDPNSAALLILGLVIIAAGIALLVLVVMCYHNLSKAFGHGAGYTVGLIFLETIFFLIIGFGSSRYVGNPTRK